MIGRGRGKRYTESGALPPISVLRISSVDDDAMLHAEPMRKEDEDAAPAPEIIVQPDRRHIADLGIGDRVLARLQKKGKGYEATIIRILPKGPERVIGLYVEVPGQGARIRPTDKRHKSEYSVEKGQKLRRKVKRSGNRRYSDRTAARFARGSDHRGDRWHPRSPRHLAYCHSQQRYSRCLSGRGYLRSQGGETSTSG